MENIHIDNFNNANSEEYNDLLETVRGLQSNLQTAHIRVSQLGKENQTLRVNKEETQLELTQVRIRFDESKKALAGQVQTTCLRERELGKLESKWRARVEQERNEIQASHKDLVDKSLDMESMRMQLCDNVEKEYEARFEIVRKEVSRSGWCLCSCIRIVSYLSIAQYRLASIAGRCKRKPASNA